MPETRDLSVASGVAGDKPDYWRAELKLLGSKKVMKLGVGHKILHFGITFSKE